VRMLRRIDPIAVYLELFDEKLDEIVIVVIEILSIRLTSNFNNSTDVVVGIPERKKNNWGFSWR
jgi:hypothetical protein